MKNLQRAKEIVATSLKVPVDKISDSAVLSDLEQIDSVTFEAIVLSLEAAMGKKLDAEKLLDLRSVADVARLLQDD